MVDAKTTEDEAQPAEAQDADAVEQDAAPTASTEPMDEPAGTDATEESEAQHAAAETEQHTPGAGQVDEIYEDTQDAGMDSELQDLEADLEQEEDAQASQQQAAATETSGGRLELSSEALLSSDLAGDAEALAGASKPRAQPVDITHPLAQDIILNPSRWRIWPAVAVLRWLLRKATRNARRIVYRSEPSLAFTPSEINDIAIDSDGIELILSAPGIAAPGSPLPLADVDRIIRNKYRGGALSAWLDGIGDRFMHALETSQTRNNIAFSLAVGGRIESLEIVSRLAGYSAPLIATSMGKLSATGRRTPEGAVGLASIYMGAISARKLEDLFRAITQLPADVKEFTGSTVFVVKPARVGRIGRGMQTILGTSCHLPEAGVEVIINGGSKPEALQWAADPVRRRSLHLLAKSYIGSALPRASLFLLLSPVNVPAAAFDGKAVFGGLAVLGKPQVPIFIPILAP